jgi:hypothetical protein
MDEFEVEYSTELIDLIKKWNRYELSESRISCNKKSPRYWSKIAPELREQAVKIRSEKEKEQKVNQENPNRYLTKDDVCELMGWGGFPSSVVEQGLQELNVEIFKRIVRKTYLINFHKKLIFIMHSFL